MYKFFWIMPDGETTVMQFVNAKAFEESRTMVAESIVDEPDFYVLLVEYGSKAALLWAWREPS